MSLDLSTQDWACIMKGRDLIKRGELLIEEGSKELTPIVKRVMGVLSDSNSMLEEDFQDSLRIVAALPRGHTRNMLLEAIYSLTIGAPNDHTNG